MINGKETIESDSETDVISTSTSTMKASLEIPTNQFSTILGISMSVEPTPS